VTSLNVTHGTKILSQTTSEGRGQGRCLHYNVVYVFTAGVRRKVANREKIELGSLECFKEVLGSELRMTRNTPE